MNESNVMMIVGNILIGVGLCLGLIAFVAWRIISRFENGMREIVRDAVQEVEDSLVGIVVEEHNGQLYCYRESNRQFVCQGNNIMEVRKVFNLMYPNKTAYLAGGDPALIERIKAELVAINEKETNENSISI
jgi:hypothetical protein